MHYKHTGLYRKVVLKKWDLRRDWKWLKLKNVWCERVYFTSKGPWKKIFVHCLVLNVGRLFHWSGFAGFLIFQIWEKPRCLFLLALKVWWKWHFWPWSWKGWEFYVNCQHIICSRGILKENREAMWWMIKEKTDNFFNARSTVSYIRVKHILPCHNT